MPHDQYCRKEGGIRRAPHPFEESLLLEREKTLLQSSVYRVGFFFCGRKTGICYGHLSSKVECIKTVSINLDKEDNRERRKLQAGARKHCDGVGF